MAFEVYTKEMQLKKGAFEFIKNMHKEGKKLGIATSNSRVLAVGLLENNQVLDDFDAIWTSDEAKAIKEQRKWVKEIPELVGGYYVSRSIVNAFRNVTNNYTNPREMLFYYNDQINDEIWRKRMEYNLYVPEEANK